MTTVTIRPVTERERVIVKRHGADGWNVIAKGTPWCKALRPSVLVEKNGHIRWMLQVQVEAK